MNRRVIGTAEVICGSMFSGKTSELGRRLEREQIAQKKVIVFKPIIDNRYSEDTVTDRNKRTEFPAVSLPLEWDKEDFSEIFNYVQNTDVVGIDEVQFFGSWIVNLCNELRDAGYRVLLCGLDMDYRGKPFGSMPQLMAISNDVMKLQAVCTTCGEDATFTQRLINGKPAPEGETIAIGDKDKTHKSPFTYEARCQGCFVPPHKVSKSLEELCNA